MAINKWLIRIIACFTNCRKIGWRKGKEEKDSRQRYETTNTQIRSSTSTSQNSNKLLEKIAWCGGRKSPVAKPEHMDKDAEEVL